MNWWELKEKVKKEISDKFFEYYDKKQWSLSMKSARFVKNKLRNKIREYEKFGWTKDTLENDQNLNKIEKLVDIFWTWYIRKSEVRDLIGRNVKEIDMIMKAWWKPLYRAKDENWKYHIIRWNEIYWEWFNEVLDFKYIWWEIVLKVNDVDWYYKVFRWNKECYWTFKDNKDKYKKIYDIHEVDWKPIFLALDSDWYYSIIIWYEKYTWDDKYTWSLARWYYKWTEIDEDLEKKQYTNIDDWYKIIWWEK